MIIIQGSYLHVCVC